MPFLEAVLTLSGMIIGAGMFAIPFVFARAGFWLGAAELGALSLVVLILHLWYADIVLATPGFHRMPGYVRQYLGYGVSILSWASSVFGITGTLLAYLIVGTLFLETIAARLAPAVPSMLLAVGMTLVVTLITYFSLKKESAINSILTIFEITFIAGLSFFLLPKISLPHFSGIHMSNLFLPYGVLLFALSGASVIPDVITILGRRRTRVRAVIIIGSLIPALLYFLFAYAVVGVSGGGTSTEAIAGLQHLLGGSIAFWASIAGFLAILTSFVALSANFQAMLRLDLRMPRSPAWFIAAIVPFALYLVGFQDFIAIISIIGILAFGVDGALLLFIVRRVKQKQRIQDLPTTLIGYIVFAIILGGITAELLRIAL